MKTILMIIFVSATAVMAQEYSPALEDNSFFIEEAYNQEDGVIQHIFKTQYSKNKDLEFVFTEEIPVINQAHQFSFELSYLSLKETSLKGMGDLVLQYRYQLFSKENWAALSPAFAVIIPAGSRTEGLGTNITGYEINIPVSKRLSENFTAHLNSGAAYFPDTDNSFTEYFAGGSIIWLAHSNLNFMFEYLLNHSVDEKGNTTEHLFVPGVRYAVNLGNLQIVPAIAAALSKDDEQYVVYLSFEHPL